jgi:hypothetical protein
MQGSWRTFWDWFGGELAPPCPPKGSTCESCARNCACEYEKAKADCDSLRCHQLAELEKSACDGGCLADFAGC